MTKIRVACFSWPFPGAAFHSLYADTGKIPRLTEAPSRAVVTSGRGESAPQGAAPRVVRLAGGYHG